MLYALAGLVGIVIGIAVEHFSWRFQKRLIIEQIEALKMANARMQVRLQAAQNEALVAHGSRIEKLERDPGGQQQT